MTKSSPEPNLFRALLRHYRQGRGMSQLDLAIAAEVSSRHISFVETGRAQASREMILRLSGALGLGLRDVNTLLHAAGLPREFPEARADVAWPAPIERVIQRMLAQQEPYPLIVFNSAFDMLRSNQAAQRVLMRFVEEPRELSERLNLLHVIFHPKLLRPHLEDWPRLARTMLNHLQREALNRPSDETIPRLVQELCNYPGVPEHWRQPELDLPATPTLELALVRDDERARFLTTVTIFNTALDVTLEELRFESFYPADEQTEAYCRKLAQ